MNPQAYFSDMDYFEVNVRAYDSSKDFVVTRPSSLTYPKSRAVMFVQKDYVERFFNILDTIEYCLVFWPKEQEVPLSLNGKYVFVHCEEPHLEYCRFFLRHGIYNLPKSDKIHERDGYSFCGNVTVGQDTQIFPYVYMNGNITIGNHCYIGAGVKITGNVVIGDYVVIRENAVLGADSLTTDREPDGRAATMPQFGGLVIGNHVEIGAGCVIARGAIDNTVISGGCKLNNNSYIAHNNFLHENVFVGGRVSTEGSVEVRKNVTLLGSVLHHHKIGENSYVATGAIVNKDVPDSSVYVGNQIKSRILPFNRELWFS